MMATALAVKGAYVVPLGVLTAESVSGAASGVYLSHADVFPPASAE